jgi:DinB superfamily
MIQATPLQAIMTSYRATNIKIIQAVQELSNEQLRWRPNRSSHSIAFIIWHLARWADHLQATIPGMTDELAIRLPPGVQLWVTTDYSTRWGFDVTRLGYEETGTDADLAGEAEPDWPGKDLLLAYAQEAFAAAELSIAAIDEAQFVALERQQYQDDYIEGLRTTSATVGNAMMSHLLHNAQHLGELYYLCGLLSHTEGQPL